MDEKKETVRDNPLNQLSESIAAIQMQKAAYPPGVKSPELKATSPTNYKFDFKHAPSSPLKDDDTHSTIDNWSTDIENILEDIRHNSEILAKHHKQSYIKLQAQLIYFRVPLIVLSALNSVFSVGLGVYIDQQTVSTTNCLISLICACISSVELFLQIQKKLELELSSYHGYYLLGTKVSAELKLERVHREVDGLNFLHSTVSEYNNLFEQSCVDPRDIDDKLVVISNPAKPRVTIN